MDYAAATPVDAHVQKAMAPYFGGLFGNASALYVLGQQAARAITVARQIVSNNLGTVPDTIIFTGGGTEANNLAIFGIAEAYAGHGKHMVVSAIEHHSLLRPLANLEKKGWQITYLPVDVFGRVRVVDVLAALRPDTVLVSVMYANNEVGTIEPIAEVGRIILKYRKEHNSIYPFFHSDACQAVNTCSLNVERLHVDLLTLNSGKIYGPKGVGCLYVRRGVSLVSCLVGGDQEFGLRAGTENVPGIVGFATAFDMAVRAHEEESRRLRELTLHFWQALKKEVPDAVLNGPALSDERLPGNLNVMFPGVESEALVVYLNEFGIMCAFGSACATQSAESSHVLSALGLNTEAARQSVRFTLGRSTNAGDIAYTVKIIVRLVHDLRASAKAFVR